MSRYNDYASEFLVNSDKYISREYLNNDKAFSREGKLSLGDVIRYPLLQEGHTGSREANNYVRLITGDDFAMVTSQAIGAKRGFIIPKVYEDMNKDFVDNLYKTFGDDLKYKGRIFGACDTSVIKVPNVSKTKEEFPVEDGKPARARLSTVADAKSGYILDAKIVEKNTGEVELAKQHINELKNRHPDEPICIVYDRGYTAFDIVFLHLDLDIEFILRLNDTMLHNEIEQYVNSDDEILRLYLNKKRTNRISDPELRKKYENVRYVDLRVTRIKITPPDGEPYTEILLSNLPMDEFTADDLKEMYNLRWTVETDYDLLKSTLELENFTGQRRIIIEQDVYAKYSS